MTEVQDFGRQLGEFSRGLLGATGADEGTEFVSDGRAESEIRGFLAELQEAYARADIDWIVNSLAEDFTTYELVALDGSPVVIREKAAMREYLTTLFPASGENQVKSITANQVVATATLGLINEEGDVVISKADTTKEHQPLRASALAVRTEDGWKWRHWHMSEAGPRFRVNAAGVPIDDNGQVIPGARVVTQDGVGRVVVDGHETRPGVTLAPGQTRRD
ncbi:nuclear transport factor 2 family protein [Salinispora tropica]|uniref:SnoaL-like domain-containing protein n=1 Tax=Salinispora tropica (strain ATCC BAA-916 / DSM 44818 / JCM 13857 / NBRC 105044 / CNB-440) TaxID=369723 RepID=A4X2J3_SALTO|nr:nuclear transport factor 2 family protein [Salinispora tropica]ABP53093.1 hypothetical protein Strop_0613 [Salinispora tropica CNB-440]